MSYRVTIELGAIELIMLLLFSFMLGAVVTLFVMLYLYGSLRFRRSY